MEGAHFDLKDVLFDFRCIKFVSKGVLFEVKMVYVCSAPRCLFHWRRFYLHCILHPKRGSFFSARR